MQIDGKAGYDPGSESTIIRLERDFFIRYLSLSKNDNIEDIFNKCPNSGCTFLGKGEISACGQPYYIKYFNEYFGENLCNEGAISIYEDGINGNEIIKRLKEPMGACQNCTCYERVDWKTTKNDPKKEDWCVNC